MLIFNSSFFFSFFKSYFPFGKAVYFSQNSFKVNVMCGYCQVTFKQGFFTTTLFCGVPFVEKTSQNTVKIGNKSHSQKNQWSIWNLHSPPLPTPLPHLSADTGNSPPTAWPDCPSSQAQTSSPPRPGGHCPEDTRHYFLCSGHLPLLGCSLLLLLIWIQSFWVPACSLPSCVTQGRRLPSLSLFPHL